jgi:hypothetical protein
MDTNVPKSTVHETHVLFPESKFLMDELRLVAALPTDSPLGVPSPMNWKVVFEFCVNRLGLTMEEKDPTCFWLDKDLVLRTPPGSIQIRVCVRSLHCSVNVLLQAIGHFPGGASYELGVMEEMFCLLSTSQKPIEAVRWIKAGKQRVLIDSQSNLLDPREQNLTVFGLSKPLYLLGAPCEDGEYDEDYDDYEAYRDDEYGYDSDGRSLDDY